MDMSKHWNCPPHNSQVPVAPGCLLLGRQSGEMTPPTIVSVLEPGQLHVALPSPEYRAAGLEQARGTYRMGASHFCSPEII